MREVIRWPLREEEEATRRLPIRAMMVAIVFRMSILNKTPVACKVPWVDLALPDL